ncbi:outer membrane protein [Filimonas lacunae]|nr:outer membrane protein [Filimonas lacunae]
MSATGLSQKVTLSVHKQPLHEVISEIAAQTGVSMIFNMEQLRTAAPVTIDLKDTPLEEALKAVFKNQAFQYEVKEGTVIIKKQRTLLMDLPVGAAPDNRQVELMVRVMDERGVPMAGVTVAIKGSKRTYVTNSNGLLALQDMPGEFVMIISSVGYEEQVIHVSPEMQAVAVHLKVKVNQLNTLELSTGMGVRKKESFTGAAAVYSGQDLKTVGNRNILESLRSLDPSFIKVENNLQGSNPNKLPDFEIRGRTSISTINLNDQFSSNPNQPLFILDGFETTLQAIYDLDMNRVASVTILKDAASTALYGSKAANGVVVVETKRPTPGRLQVSYNGDFQVDVPDLRSYNLMNAAEKLQFDKLAGRYSSTGQLGWESEAVYNARLAEVQKGVNTYWLSEPVQTGFSNKHSVQVTGGSPDLMVNAGILYSKQNGVMKGSGRDNWSGNINLSYRKGRVNISNLFTVRGNTAIESPYGSFSDFANAIPYYRKRNDDGSIPRYLDPLYDTSILNPLYNASIYSKNQTQQFAFQNNLQAIVTLSPSFRLQGAVLVGKGNTTTLVFIPPDNSAFQGLPANQQGSYQNTRLENSQYNANLMLTYAKLVNRHQFTASVRGDVQQQKNNTVGFTAVGFPYGTDGSPAFAYGFMPYSTPVASNITTRSVGFLTNLNYVYDRRFMLDAVYRLDGTSVFGSSRQFKPFVSAGLGWNLHNEQFMKQLKWVNLLKLRGNMGYSGNENIGTFSSVSLYNYISGNTNNFGQGLTVASLGNPVLDWQKTLQESYGVDFNLLNNRVSGSVEYFHKKTDPLAVGAAGTLPSSAGVNANYVLNLGYLTTKGWTVNVRVSPVYNLKDRIIWTIGVMGSNYTSRYGGFSNRLSELNKAEQDANGLSRYYDGYSPDDMWAVVSRGIDPATGVEVFQKKNGKLTYDYDPADIVKVGNTRPTIEGTMNTTLAYKDFTLGAVVRYQVGGYVFNNALFNKVETNSSATFNNNMDRRALYDRWQKPGDVAQFAGIGTYASRVMSSRFIQKDTHFTGESFSIGYRVNGGWVKKMQLQTLGINLYLNDIFRIESILTERGIDYPYARTFSFSINASF